MTYNIPVIHVPSDWWFILWVVVGVVSIIVWAVAAFLDEEKIGRKRTLLSLPILVLGVGFAVTAIMTVAHQQGDVGAKQVDATAKAWGLDENDASYLLATTYNPDGDCGFGVCDTATPALVTVDGKPAKAYLLRQGDSLRLIVDKKPLAVIGR